MAAQIEKVIYPLKQMMYRFSAMTENAIKSLSDLSPEDPSYSDDVEKIIAKINSISQDMLQVSAKLQEANELYIAYNVFMGDISNDISACARSRIYIAEQIDSEDHEGAENNILSIIEGAHRVSHRAHEFTHFMAILPEKLAGISDVSKIQS